MGDSTNNISSLMYRIEQLEQERDELRKDIEQLCMQQSGTGYIGIITRIQAQRTAGLEQEIETLKQKLVSCTRENGKLQEELSEVYHIKSQFAELYESERAKNSEAEKQVKFFQSRVAAAFSDRDRALMEVERAQKKETSMSHRLNELQNRIEEMTADRLEEMKLCSELESNLCKSKTEIAKLKQVIDKLYEIRQAALGVLDSEPDEDKAACLLQDPSSLWSFGEVEDRSKDYHCQMVAMQEELIASRDTVVKLQKQLEEARASEEHLAQRISTLEAKLKHSENNIKNELSLLRNVHAQKRNGILNVIEEEQKWLESMTGDLEIQIKHWFMYRMNASDSFESKGDGQITSPEQSESTIPNENADSSSYGHAEVVSDSRHLYSEGQMSIDDYRKALARALQEKVQALLLLSQQEERHLLEKNTDAALEEKIKELRQTLLQVTNEKVAALMEVAQLRQECQHWRQISPVSKHQHNSNASSTAVSNEKDWRVKHLLKRVYLKHWLKGIDIPGLKPNAHNLEDDSSSTTNKCNDAMNFARLKVENASLQESMANIEQLTTSIHRLRLSLLKAKEDAHVSSLGKSAVEAIDDIINEAQHIKTALGSSLPVSWSADTTSHPPDSSESEIGLDGTEDQTNNGLDSVSAAGLELAELLIFASELQKTEILHVISSSAS